MNRVLSEPIPDPASAGMPEPLASVIRRATQRRLGDRYSSAADLVADLGTSASTAAVAGPPPAHKQPLHPTVPADPAPADQQPPHPSSVAGSPPAHQQPPHPTALADSIAARQRPPHPSSVPVAAVAGDAPTEAMRALERSPVTGYPHDGRVMPQIAVGRPGPEHQHRKRRRRGPVLFGLAFVAAVAAGGAGLWFYAGLGDDADPELAFPEGSSGPLDEGVSYDLAVAGDHEDATYRLVVDGQAVGSPEPTIKPFVPEAGRHSVAVEVTMGSSVDVTEPVEVYVIGQLPGESYRANLESVMADPVNWSAAIRAFDQLVAAGHDDLLLLPSERFVSLTTGYWSLLVAGFEDREAARGYCERFGREIPNECFTARFTPSA
jgi:hypothetical protein